MGYLRTLLDLDAKRRFQGKTYTADTVGNGDKCRSLGSGSRDNCSLPGNLNVQADKGAGTKKKDREVSGPDVECGNHDDGAGQGNKNSHDDVPTVLKTSST